MRGVPSPDALLTFGIASFVLFCIPGPAVAYIVNRAVVDGRASAFASVAGLELGNLVHVLAATAGLSAILATSATAFTVVKWLGAGYLIVIGLKTITTRPPTLGAGAGTLHDRGVAVAVDDETRQAVRLAVNEPNGIDRVGQDLRAMTALLAALEQPQRARIAAWQAVAMARELGDTQGEVELLGSRARVYAAQCR